MCQNRVFPNKILRLKYNQGIFNFDKIRQIRQKLKIPWLYFKILKYNQGIFNFDKIRQIRQKLGKATAQLKFRKTWIETDYARDNHFSNSIVSLHRKKWCQFLCTSVWANLTICWDRLHWWSFCISFLPRKAPMMSTGSRLTVILQGNFDII